MEKYIYLRSIVHIAGRFASISSLPFYNRRVQGKEAEGKNMNLFKPTFEEEYELALKTGNKRFGSDCKHENVVNGTCSVCLRKVI